MTLDEVARKLDIAKHQADRMQRWCLNHRRTAATDDVEAVKALQRKFSAEIKFWRDVLARKRPAP